MKILIVDDTEEIREVLRLFIEKHGHEVIEAVDGQDGFEKAKIHKPDLIITDVMMPKVDGFTLLRNIKMDPNLSSIPCVFYSAIYTGSKDRELALSLGAEAFIEKPKTPEKFLEKIQTILERKKQPAAQIEKRMIDDEKEFLKSYSQTVVVKLEEKVKELEKVIAENKQMEKTLRENKDSLQKSETMFKTFFENNPDGIIIVNREGHIVQINKQGETMLGYTRDELINQTIDILVPERFRERHVKYRDGYFAEPSIRAMGMCLGISARRKDGSEISVDIMLSPLYANAEMCVICVVRDVTERVQTEKAMRKSEARLAHAQRIAHLGSWEWNIITNELRWADETYRILGLTPQEFGATYETFLNSVHPDDREFVKKSVNDALYEKMPYSIDHRIVLPNGTERIVHEQAEVVFDSAGKAIQMNGTVQASLNVNAQRRKSEDFLRLLTRALIMYLLQMRKGISNM